MLRSMIDAAAPTGGNVMLEAAPNPVPEGTGPGTTLISWRTQAEAARVYVSVEGGPERLFASGAEGTAEADWIWPGTHYEFRLYDDDMACESSVLVRKKFGREASGLLGEEAALDADDHDDERLRLLLAHTLQSTSSCIDVGGNEGKVLAQMVHVAPHGHHICFEPIPDLHRDLSDRFRTVDVRRIALSRERGTREFVYVRSHPGYSGFRERSYPGQEETEMLQVSVDRLDDVLPGGYVPALIKIDVEGAEQEVLEGAIATIRRHKPVVVFEHGRGAADHYGTRPESVFELLAGACGLSIFDLDGNGPYTARDFVETFESGVRWNFVARAW
jgi:FkbM family methyltransferase